MWNKYLHKQSIVYEGTDLNWVISDDNIYINYDDFKNKKIQALYITGLSGSGKSTLGRKIAKESKAEYIELDKFSLKQHDGYIKKYFDSNPKEYEEYLSCWGDKPYIANLPKFRNCVVSAVAWILEHHRNKQFILEGVQVPYIYDISIERKIGLFDSKKYAVILVSTSSLKSYIRRSLRDGIGKSIFNTARFFEMYKSHHDGQNSFRKNILKKSGIDYKEQK